MFKAILIVLLLFVIGSLFTAFYHLIKGGANSDRVVKSLSWRIGLSLFILLLLFIGVQMGLVVPLGGGG